MIMILLRKSFPLAVFGLLASAVMPGCGGPSATAEDVCANCGSDTATIQACVKNIKGELSAVKQIGCGPQFQGLLDCLRDEGKCLTGSHDDETACASDRVAAANCISAIF